MFFPLPITGLFVFILGLFIGSFLNVVIFRVHSGESIVFGRSHCMLCKKELFWYELIPVLSFLLQRGKCRHCGSPLSKQYPLVEFATGALFYLAFISLQTISYFSSPLYPIPYILYPIFIWAVCSISIVIFVYDLRYFLIPDVYLLWGSALVLAAEILGIWHAPAIALPLGSATGMYILSLLATACLSALPFFAIVFFSKGAWMGFGDVKLTFFMGLVLGLHSFLAIFVGVLSGAIMGIGLMAVGRAGMKTLLPFGPFLIFGMLAVLFWGPMILAYLSNLFWIPLQ